MMIIRSQLKALLSNIESSNINKIIPPRICPFNNQMTISIADAIYLYIHTTNLEIFLSKCTTKKEVNPKH
jgi:hypothetical protein